MNIHQLNFQTVNKALGFDDSELHKVVQCDHMGSTSNTSLFYISSYNDKYGDVDAYVICDDKGVVSYYDMSNKVVCYKGKVREDWLPCTCIPSEFLDELEQIINDYYFESGGVSSFSRGGNRIGDKILTEDDITAGIEPFLKLLEKMYNYV